MTLPFQNKITSNLNTIAFYNLENLYDTVDDAITLDDEFTHEGGKRWSTKRYKRKLYKLAKTISQIGLDTAQDAPVVVGLAELENERVLKDLIASEPLKAMDYGYVHYDSPDERGIDTGLLYNKKYFKVRHSEPIALMVDNLDGNRDTTRDMLYVLGELNGEDVHVFINHWPSRRQGAEDTDYKRIQAAETLLRFMAVIELKSPNANYIIMGDFNDGPYSKSIKTLMQSNKLFNPAEKLLSNIRGSANYQRKWSLFDQIIFSHNFLNYEKGTHSFAHANIFDEAFLMEATGKFKGNPFRTYAGDKYLGGYSDHFPVYVQLRYNA